MLTSKCPVEILKWQFGQEGSSDRHILILGCSFQTASRGYTVINLPERKLSELPQFCCLLQKNNILDFDTFITAHFASYDSHVSQVLGRPTSKTLFRALHVTSFFYLLSCQLSQPSAWLKGSGENMIKPPQILK